MSIFRRLAYSLGIKLRLLILVLLAVAPLVALIAWDVVDDRRTAIEQAGIAALQSARLAASRQSDALNEAITLTEGMRSIPTITVEGETPAAPRSRTCRSCTLTSLRSACCV